MAEIGYTMVLAAVALLWTGETTDRSHRILAHTCLSIAGIGFVLARSIVDNGPEIGLLVAICCGMLGGIVAVAIASATTHVPIRAYLIGAIGLFLGLGDILYANG